MEIPTKEQRFQDRLFSALSAPVSHRPGEPCDHPGCASHLSHPCKGCGRYAAGLQNGPDVDHARARIERLAQSDPVMRYILMLGQQSNWTWEQTMSAIVIRQNELIKNTERELHEAIINQTFLSPFASSIDKPK